VRFVGYRDAQTEGSLEIESARLKMKQNPSGVAHSDVLIKWRARTIAAVTLLTPIGCLFAQSPPVSSNRPWHSIEEHQIANEARRVPGETLGIEPGTIYSLAELIDLAEAHNPATRVAWESARAQAPALGIARSDLFPTLSTVALVGVTRDEAGFGAQFYRQTLPSSAR